MAPVKRLLRLEFRLFGIGYACSLLFFGFYGILFSWIITDAATDRDVVGVFADVILLLFGQILGLGITKYNFANPFRDDQYSKKMRVLHRLPVRFKQIAVYRLIVVILLSAANAVALYVPAWLGSAFLRSSLQWPEALSLLYVLLLFSIVCSCFYAYMEIGYTGRTYYMVSILIIFLSIAFISILYQLGGNITLWLVERAQAGFGGWTYVWTSIIAAVAMWLFVEQSDRRMKRREYEQ